MTAPTAGGRAAGEDGRRGVRRETGEPGWGVKRPVSTHSVHCEGVVDDEEEPPGGHGGKGTTHGVSASTCLDRG